MNTPLRSVALFAICLAAVGAAHASPARGETLPCKETERSRPAAESAKNLLELQPNAARPTFDVELGYATSGSDEISFVPKGGKRPGQQADVAAEFTDAPRFNGHRLGGDKFIAAHASESGRRIVLEACFENIPQYAAGRYAGTVSVYGPTITDFTYAIVVTTKWPRWTALSTIGLTILGSFIVAFFTGVLTFPKRKRGAASKNDDDAWKGYLKLLFAVVLAAGLATLSYWSVYASNETWGSTPPSDLTALVGAAFAAAVGGLVTARKLLSDST
jgi:hypothetical protein